MMVGRRPSSCQWTARQLATVLLPLPPFMVATVMIELVTFRLPPSARATNPSRINAIVFLADCLPAGTSDPAQAVVLRLTPGHRAIRGRSRWPSDSDGRRFAAAFGAIRPRSAATDRSRYATVRDRSRLTSRLCIRDKSWIQDGLKIGSVGRFREWHAPTGYSWSPASRRGRQRGGEPEENNPLPLSDAQLGIWFAQTIDPSNPAYNLAEYLEIDGPIDATLFETALRQVVNETEALCVRFVSGADGPRQIIGVSARVVALIRRCQRRGRSASGGRTMDEGGSGKADRPHRRSALRLCAVQSGARPFLLVLAIPSHRDGRVRLRARCATRGGRLLALAAGLTADASTFGSLAHLLEDDAGYRASKRFEQDRQFWMELPRRSAGTGEPGRSAAAKSPDFIRHTGSLPFSTIEQLHSIAAAPA